MGQAATGWGSISHSSLVQAHGGGQLKRHEEQAVTALGSLSTCFLTRNMEGDNSLRLARNAYGSSMEICGNLLREGAGIHLWDVSAGLPSRRGHHRCRLGSSLLLLRWTSLLTCWRREGSLHGEGGPPRSSMRTP